MPPTTKERIALNRRAQDHFWCPACQAEPGKSCRKLRGSIAGTPEWPPHKARIAAVTDTDATPSDAGAVTIPTSTGKGARPL